MLHVVKLIWGKQPTIRTYILMTTHHLSVLVTRLLSPAVSAIDIGDIWAFKPMRLVHLTPPLPAQWSHLRQIRDLYWNKWCVTLCWPANRSLGTPLNSRLLERVQGKSIVHTFTVERLKVFIRIYEYHIGGLLRDLRFIWLFLIQYLHVKMYISITVKRCPLGDFFVFVQ